MAWPKTRLRTYGVDTPVSPNDLNDIQDAIIGAKHGDIVIPIHASKFVGQDIAFIDGGASAGWTQSLINSAARVATAPLDLPAGTHIVSVEFVYNVGGGGFTVTPALRQERPSTGAYIFGWGTIGDNTGAAIETATVTPNHTLIAGDSYSLRFELADDSNRIYGAFVTIDKP